MTTEDHDRESIVSRALGPFGLWQARGCLLLALCKIPAAWHMLNILYSSPQPSAVDGRFWCARPSRQWSVDQWIDYSHPTRITLKGTNDYDPCSVYDIEYHRQPSINLFRNTNNTRLCNVFEFEQPYPTLVSEWSLVCSHDVLVHVIQHFYLEGIVLGGVANYLLLKRISPRSAVIIGAILHIIAGTGAAFVPVFQFHLILKMLLAFGTCIMFSAAFQICADITNGWQKIVICVCYEHFWSIGVISLGWLSDISQSWANLQIITSVPTVILLLCTRWIPESPSWLIDKGRIESAEKLLHAGAAMNHRKLPPDFQIETQLSSPSTKVPPYPSLRMVGLLVLWTTTVVTYYCGLLNIKNTGGPRLPIRTSLAGVAEVIGASIGMILLLRCRPWTRFANLSAILAIGGTICIGSWAIPPTRGGGRGGWLLLGLALLGRVAIASSFAVLSGGGSTDILPARYRALTMVVFVTVSRIVLSGVPFLNSMAKHGESITLSMYGSITLLGAAAASYLAILLQRQQQNCV